VATEDIPLEQVGVREFRDGATRYLSGSEAVAVRKHGRLIGIYFPIGRDPERLNRSLDEIESSIARFRAETGMSEDELAQWLNIRDPLPE
jgi:hypothetical protein